MIDQKIQDWLTHAERTQWEETSRYPEVVDYCKRLQEASPWIRYCSFGTSPQGRDLPLLIVSDKGNFTSEEAHRTGSVVVLIINGIHSGEIAGKEASLMLLRDIAVMRERTDFLNCVTLLVVPIFNVDGHELFSPYNRINQNGPREMGWRATAQNLNLNRDWMKADQPEMQAMLRLYNSWFPHLVIDNHVTNGGDYQYDVTYILDDHPRVADPVRHYMKRNLEPHLESMLREKGHISTSYFEFRDNNNPAEGINSPPLSARFSDGYGTLQNRPTIVVETHMLKSFEIRIKAHYDLMTAVLVKLNREPETIKEVVRLADRQAIELGSEYRPDAAYPISVELSDDSEPFPFKGVQYSLEMSNVSGATKVTYGTEHREFTIPHRHTCYTDKTVVPPLGYVVPAEWITVAERLSLHGIRFRRLDRTVTGEFETYRFTDVGFEAFPYEGRQTAKYKLLRVIEQRTLPEGSMVIRLNQRTNRVILGLMEPDSPDSFVAWGFFNAIFEEKEYAEDYVLEKMAQRMLDVDPALRLEFKTRLERDPEFALEPSARLRFFYDRSPYKDPRKNAYPVVRITRPEQFPS